MGKFLVENPIKQREQTHWYKLNLSMFCKWDDTHHWKTIAQEFVINTSTIFPQISIKPIEITTTKSLGFSNSDSVWEHLRCTWIYVENRQVKILKKENSKHFLFSNSQYNIITSCAYFRYPTHMAAGQKDWEEDIFRESFISPGTGTSPGTLPRWCAPASSGPFLNWLLGSLLLGSGT